MGRPTQVVPGSQCGPSERSLSHTASRWQDKDPSGRIVGNEGLSIRSFRTMEPLEDGAKGGLESNFRRTLMHMRHGDEHKAIIGMRKFSMLMHELDEKQLWMGLETLKDAGSDFERGRELRFNSMQMLGIVESELWLRLGILAETGGDRDADPNRRAGAFRTMEWLYPRLNKLLAERGGPQNAVVGDAEEDGKIGAGLPAWNKNSVRVAMEEAAKQHAASMSEGALQIERKMASAILNVVYQDDGADRRVYEAAFRAFDNIDSPIMTDMLTRDVKGFQLRGGSTGPAEEKSGRDAPLRTAHPEFELDDLDPRMIIRDPNDRD